MNRKQFIVMAVSRHRNLFFNESIMAGRYFMAAFWAVLVLRNLQISYVMGPDCG